MHPSRAPRIPGASNLRPRGRNWGSRSGRRRPWPGDDRWAAGGTRRAGTSSRTVRVLRATGRPIATPCPHAAPPTAGPAAPRAGRPSAATTPAAVGAAEP
eukprot:3086199-Lingulodinium_polyedra.AAC.1